MDRFVIDACCAEVLSERLWVTRKVLNAVDGQHSMLATPFAADADRYRRMLAEFRAVTGSRPYLNHCTIACTVGAQHFGVTDADLQTRPNRDIVATRQKIMAFTRVVTGAGYHQIARVFNIDHSAVIRACERHEDFIRQVLARKIEAE
ncbi:helix-turn-helix domain-containing protein [Bradyrhizobium sp. DASA03120]|uniref:helix-turn-helix domain-containing protein n=1 Tax=Bradyrhizobium sp. SMVTL-02 TaxID=3395917 RepID=UPI003F727057